MKYTLAISSVISNTLDLFAFLKYSYMAFTPHQFGQKDLIDARNESHWFYWGVGLFSCFANLLLLTDPLYMLQIYDRVLSSRSEATLVALSLVVVFLYMVMGLLDFACGRIMARVGTRFQARLDHRVFDAMLRRSAVKQDPLAAGAATKLARMDIKAPVSDIVYGLVVHAPRSVIRPADPVLYLILQDRPLVIAARIEPIHIDQIFLGQEVALQFSALDQRKTPELYGIVTIISADAFQDQKGQEPFYRAEIVLRDGELERLPPGLMLIPGMPVKAFIRTAARSPLNYFLKPLSNYFIRAFRET